MENKKEVQFSWEKLIYPPLKASSIDEVKIEKSSQVEKIPIVPELPKQNQSKNNGPYYPTQSVPEGVFRTLDLM